VGIKSTSAGGGYMSILFSNFKERAPQCGVATIKFAGMTLTTAGGGYMSILFSNFKERAPQCGVATIKFADNDIFSTACGGYFEKIILKL
jgi:predicted AlkP superfamily phosphohydrolase/phosphomutase